MRTSAHSLAPTVHSFLVFEYWRVSDDDVQSPPGDGLMVASKGVPAQGSFQDGAQSLTLTTLHSALPLPAHLAHADWTNFDIGRPFQMLNVPVERGAWAGLHAWFVGVQNVAVWVVGNVSYALRCVLTPTQDNARPSSQGFVCTHRAAVPIHHGRSLAVPGNRSVQRPRHVYHRRRLRQHHPSMCPLRLQRGQWGHRLLRGAGQALQGAASVTIHAHCTRCMAVLRAPGVRVPTQPSLLCHSPPGAEHRR